MQGSNKWNADFAYLYYTYNGCTGAAGCEVMDVKFLRPYMQVAHLLALVHHAHCLVSPRIHLKVYNCDPPMPAVSQNDTPIQGILRGGNDGNVRAIDCTDALRKPPFG